MVLQIVSLLSSISLWKDKHVFDIYVQYPEQISPPVLFEFFCCYFFFLVCADFLVFHRLELHQRLSLSHATLCHSRVHSFLNYISCGM